MHLTQKSAARVADQGKCSSDEKLTLHMRLTVIPVLIDEILSEEAQDLIQGDEYKDDAVPVHPTESKRSSANTSIDASLAEWWKRTRSEENGLAHTKHPRLSAGRLRKPPGLSLLGQLRTYFVQKWRRRKPFAVSETGEGD